MNSQDTKSNSKWRNVKNALKFIKLSKKAAKKTNDEDLDVEKIDKKGSKWRLLKNSINFLTRLKSENSFEQEGSKVSLSKYIMIMNFPSLLIAAKIISKIIF